MKPTGVFCLAYLQDPCSEVSRLPGMLPGPCQPITEMHWIILRPSASRKKNVPDRLSAQLVFRPCVPGVISGSPGSRKYVPGAASDSQDRPGLISRPGSKIASTSLA